MTNQPPQEGDEGHRPQKGDEGNRPKSGREAGHERLGQDGHEDGHQGGPGRRLESGDPEGGERRVQCAKLGRELPGLAAPPFPDELGRRIFESISQEAWTQWIRHSQMIINEHALVLSDPGARDILMRECEAFLFGSGTAPPPGWVPPGGTVRINKPD